MAQAFGEEGAQYDALHGPGRPCVGRPDEGAHLLALREIRVRAAPSWDADQVQLNWWFVKDDDPQDVPADWPTLFDRWLALFEQDEGGRFRLDAPIACRLEDMTARDYVDSDRLDLDRLSVT